MSAEDIKHYLRSSIKSFLGDKADSRFQEGYLAALRDVYGDNFMTDTQRTEYRKNYEAVEKKW